MARSGCGMLLISTDPASSASSWAAGGLISVAFSPDGRTLVSNDGSTIQLWNVADPAHPRLSDQSLTSGTGTDVLSVALSPDGRTLASGNNDGTIQLWDLADPAAPVSSVSL